MTHPRIVPRSWNGQTFHPETRRMYADIAADECNTFRKDAYLRLTPLGRDAALKLGERVRSFRSMQEGTLRHYDTEQVLGVEEFKGLAYTPAAFMTAAMWLGAVPKVLDVSAWSSEVTGNAPEHAQKWHRDVDDWRACKLFVYLSDVGEDNGPHQMIPGSHRAEYFHEKGLAPDAYFFADCRQVKDEPDHWPRMEFTGDAGTTFMVNTYALHRGGRVRSGSRTVFQCLYGLHERSDISDKRDMIRQAWGV